MTAAPGQAPYSSYLGEIGRAFRGNVLGYTPTYRYAKLAFAMVATPTDAFVIQGSPTKTVSVKSIKITGAATAAGTMPVTLVKRSSAGTLGSAVLTAFPTPGQLDSTDAAPTAGVFTVGTANYGTLGTAAGIFGAARLCLTALATGLGVQPVVWDFSMRKPAIIRGVGEFLCVNFNGAAIPSGGVIDIEIETEEDAS